MKKVSLLVLAVITPLFLFSSCLSSQKFYEFKKIQGIPDSNVIVYFYGLPANPLEKPTEEETKKYPDYATKFSPTFLSYVYKESPDTKKESGMVSSRGYWYFNCNKNVNNTFKVKYCVNVIGGTYFQQLDFPLDLSNETEKEVYIKVERVYALGELAGVNEVTRDFIPKSYWGIKTEPKITRMDKKVAEAEIQNCKTSKSE